MQYSQNDEMAQRQAQNEYQAQAGQIKQAGAMLGQGIKIKDETNLSDVSQLAVMVSDIAGDVLGEALQLCADFQLPSSTANERSSGQSERLPAIDKLERLRETLCDIQSALEATRHNINRARARLA